MSTTGTYPGRPRTFEPEVALDAAVDAFHRAGIASTTYGALEAATGVRRQSLVYAFGDKRTLFEAALKRYARRRVTAIVQCLGAPGSAAAGIRAAFALWLDDARNTSRPGCLLVNTAGEIGRDDPALADVVEAATAELVEAFTAAFFRAREAGELHTDADPVDLARLAVAAGDGALLHARSAGDASLAEASFRALLAATLL